LDDLVWDDTPRINNLLTTYAAVAAEDETLSYIQAIGSRWMIGAVARIFNAGVKVDSALVLVGKQDLLKSRFFAVLGGDWFTDQIPDLKSKDAAIQLAGVWIIEFAELKSIRSADIDTIKAFMSRQVDRYRAPYGRQAANYPRQNAFGGTTNDDEYLNDPTGAKRFWSARVTGPADVEALAKDRDQLWAEAVHRFRQGEKWWLHEKELIETAAEVADEHFASDPWEAPIREWLSFRDIASVDMILDGAIMKDVEKWTRGDESRVGTIVRLRLKWMKKQVSRGVNRGKRYYLRPEVWERMGVGWEELIEPAVAADKPKF
jgi:putative DNA primase/helicase